MNSPDAARAPARLVPVEQLNAISSLIAEGAVFEGSFSSRQDLGLKVDGLLQGDISFQNGGTVHVGATGVIESTTIEADHVLIEGKVRGTVIARKSLEITGTATLLGDALYDALLDIHPRARLRGKVEYRGEIEGHQLEQQRPFGSN
ncbi:polymer-forming cytoskeletal protein [Ideonella sp. 4Y11]|uniref:Polymer-forming cytoskeletal protein n=1 Tax=Ideonella aquatica TaxID=2824119 RepID=A0A940YEQ0_9BURK|nr:polymer-forming cytoskeletal protein [Ideonella aquatica]MBQ0957392.1 polymer-forming cytoskeletal protein [Ideonella aquatica]